MTALSKTELMLKGYGLTTAEFFYYLPDYKGDHIIQALHISI